MTQSEQARIAARYPNRGSRRLALAVTLLLATAGLIWVVWTGLYHALPPVSGRVSSFQVMSDEEVRLVLTVDRPDPSVPATCTVIAQAVSFERVGQLDVKVPSSDVALADIPVVIRTLSRATSVSLLSCSPSR